jgi:hypothetical protein
VADPTPASRTGDDTDVAPDRGSMTGAPRWVKVSGVIVLVLVALFVVLQLIGLGGQHGPGRHSPGGGSDTISDTAGGHTGHPPA